MWKFVPQVPHSVCTSSSIWFSHISWTTNNQLDFVFEPLNNMLSNIEDEVNTLLRCNPTYESKEGNGIINILEMEILLLKLFLGS